MKGNLHSSSIFGVLIVVVVFGGNLIFRKLPACTPSTNVNIYVNVTIFKI